MDNLKKKKEDAKRISRQRHEIAYIRKIAQSELTVMQLVNKDKKIPSRAKYHLLKMIRLCKAVLKFIK